MIKRNDTHKTQLVNELIDTGIADYGLISVLKIPPNLSHHGQEKIQLTQVPWHPLPCQTLNDPKKSRIYIAQKNIYISDMILALHDIEKLYKNIPLVIHPESTLGIFLNTEKCLWPILLGKIFLIYGRPQLMQSIQEFYDIDLDKIINLNFDTYGFDEHKQRLTTLVSDNRDLLINAQNVYVEYQDQLENARWSIGKNMYRFFCKQLEKI